MDSGDGKKMRTALLLSFAILLGRLSGLVRDMILSRSFGVSADYDVYSLAIMIPFFLRKIFAEGALTSAYIPTYNEKIKISEDEANAFTSKVFVLFSSVTLFLILLVEIHPNIVVKLFASGLDQGRILKAQVMVRITFPFILFITIWSIAYGFLNSHSRYFNPAFSQVIANVTLIVGTILSVILNFGIVGVAVAFTIGGFLQMVYLLVDMKKHDFKFKFNLNTKMGDFPKIFFVSLLSFSISQLNSIVDLNIASRLPEGSISLMQYSLRIYNLPLGIFAIAFSTYAFPKLSRMNSKDKRVEFSKNLENILFFVIPFTVLFLTLGDRVVSILYEGGRFGDSDVLETYKVLFMYSLGLPLYSFIILSYKLHYSSKDPITVMKTTLWSVAVNIIFDLLLYKRMGPSGLALATTIAGAVGTLRLLFSRVNRRYLRLNVGFLKILIAGVVLTILNLAILRKMDGRIIPMLLSCVLYILILLTLRYEYMLNLLSKVAKIRTKSL